MNVNEWIDIDTLLYRVAALVAALSIRIWAQQLIASVMGIRKQLAIPAGKQPWNPMSYLDFLGTAAILAGPYGWSRPVNVSEGLEAGERRKLALLFWLGGSAATLLFAYASGFFFHNDPLGWFDSGSTLWSKNLLSGLVQWCYIVNVMLFIIHMLPLYPADLWRVVKEWLPEKGRVKAQRIEPWMTALLAALVVTPAGRLLLRGLYDAVNGWLTSFY